MNKFSSFINNVNNKIALFCLFIATSFLPFRHVMNFADASRAGWFSELLAISIYTADFFFLFVLFAERKHFFRHSKQNYLLFGAILVFLIAETLRNPITSLGIYSLVRIIQFLVLVYLFSKFLREQKTRLYVSATLVGIGMFESLLGFFQVIVGHSFGLYFLAEQTLSTGMAGVAKVDLNNGEKLLRAYGTMPHPNILGGFLVLSICAGLYLFYKYPSKRRISGISIIIMLAGATLTFSRSALFSIFLLIFILFWQFRLWNYFLYRRTIFYTIFIIIGILMIISPLRTAIWHRISPPTSDLFFSDRIILNEFGTKIFMSDPLFGIGLGNYFNSLTRRAPFGTGLKNWQYDYPHNTLILVMTDLGIFGTIVILYFIYKTLKPVHNSTNALLVTLLIISPLILLDHYLWTNQAGRVMLVIFLTLIPAILSKHPDTTLREERNNVPTVPTRKNNQSNL
ncbi:MAG: O-antigen ligase family protein [bacterium]|nr:O-antigen ligase family protein [bacterium]